jgi:hypothetical protein
MTNNTAPRAYKGWSIHKQHIGPCGWNIVNPEGRCIKTGLATLVAARQFINWQIEAASIPDGF